MRRLFDTRQPFHAKGRATGGNVATWTFVEWRYVQWEASMDFEPVVLRQSACTESEMANSTIRSVNTITTFAMTHSLRSFPPPLAKPASRQASLGGRESAHASPHTA